LTTTPSSAGRGPKGGKVALTLTLSSSPGAVRGAHEGGDTRNTLPDGRSATPLYTSRWTGWLNWSWRSQGVPALLSLLILMVPEEPVSQVCQSAVQSWKGLGPDSRAADLPPHFLLPMAGAGWRWNSLGLKMWTARERGRRPSSRTDGPIARSRL